MKTINVNGAKFAKNDSALVETLFDLDGTARGTFKIRKRGVEFYKPDGDLFAYLVANEYGERFFVSAFIHDGKKHYMQSTTSEAESLLNLEGLSYLEGIELARNVWKAALSEKLN